MQLIMCEICIVAITIAFGLHTLKDKSVSYMVCSAVFLSWYFGSLGLILLPQDIVLAKERLDVNATLAMLEAWKVLYWATFFLSWIILPFLVEYSQCALLTTKARLMTAGKRVLRSWMYIIIASTLFIFYLLAVNHLSFVSIAGHIMAASNTYGQLWVIALLGHGLVDVPRNFIRKISTSNCLRRLFFKATKVHEEYVESTFVYEDAVRECRRSIAVAHVQNEDILCQYIVQITKQIPENVYEDLNKSKKGNTTKCTTEIEMADMLQKITRANFEVRVCKSDWMDLCARIAELQKLHFEMSGIENGRDWTTHFFQKMHWYWKLYCTPYFYVLLALVATCLSSVIFWSEATMGFGKSLSPFGVVLEDATSSDLFQFGPLCVLVYMGICAFTSLFQLKFFGKYRLRSKGLNDELSLLNNAIYQCRVQFALGYNFILLLNAPEVTNYTAFHLLFEKMQVVHFFGTAFSTYAPLLMLALASFTLFNGCSHLLGSIGLEQHLELIDGHPEHEFRIRQGQSQVEKYNVSL